MMRDVALPWNWTEEEPIPQGQHVIGLHLSRFVNAPWRWSTPYIYYEGMDYPCPYERPDVWMRVTFPTVPGQLPFETPYVPAD